MKKILLILVIVFIGTRVNAQQILPFENYSAGDLFYVTPVEKSIGDQWAENALANPQQYHLADNKPNFLLTKEGTIIINFYKGTWHKVFLNGTLVYTDYKKPSRVFYQHSK